MRTRVVKWLCIAVLFGAFVLWQWIALLFNPAIPAFPLANTLSLAAIALSAAAFAVSLTRLKSLPLLSMPPIADRNPGSESL